MLCEHRRVLLEDEPCPISDELLGALYRVDPHGLNKLIATVPPKARALLAIYCYRRVHLAAIGLAIAATCEEDDLASLGGNVGTALFDRSREAPQLSLIDAHASSRQKITLATRPNAPPKAKRGRRRLTSVHFNANGRNWPAPTVCDRRADAGHLGYCGLVSDISVATEDDPSSVDHKSLDTQRELIASRG